MVLVRKLVACSWLKLMDVITNEELVMNTNSSRQKVSLNPPSPRLIGREGRRQLCGRVPARGRSPPGAGLPLPGAPAAGAPERQGGHPPGPGPLPVQGVPLGAGPDEAPRRRAGGGASDPGGGAGGGGGPGGRPPEGAPPPAGHALPLPEPGPALQTLLQRQGSPASGGEYITFNEMSRLSARKKPLDKMYS